MRLVYEMCVTNEIFDVASLLMPNSLRNEKEFCLGNKGIKMGLRNSEYLGWIVKNKRKERGKKKEKGKPPLDLVYSR